MYRSTLSGEYDGQTVDVIMGWQSSAATNVVDAATLAQRVFDNWATHVMVDLTTQYHLSLCTVIGMDDTTVGAVHAGDEDGGGSAGGQPAFIVANVKLTTGVRGRSYTGRFGIPALGAGTIDPGNPNFLDSGTILTLQSDIADFISNTEGGVPTFQLSVISTISGGTPRTTPIATEVTTAAVQAALGTRNSRKA